MAMNGTVMGDAVVTALESIDTNMTAEQKAQLRTSWEAICGAIVSHITANAQVTSTVAVASVGGVTTGAGVSGPGTGTATGTVA